MTREEFTGLFIGFIIKKTPKWLPEEETEQRMLDIMQIRIKEHNTEIRKVLDRNNRHDDES